jgi:1-acyl-sn-glycerol-3-phosphate acyltransferase
MLDFRPPKDTPALIWLVKALLPCILKFQMQNARIEVVGDALERFARLKGKRTVICPNHPCRDDPQVMFAFSKLAGEDFNFLAAREVFDWDGGMRGWWFQHLGCYSVVRGAPDRESFKTTRRLIVEGKKKLVIFPEGEISRQNDTIMALESGVAQMGFWALEELQKTQPSEPVFLLPMALKYTYSADVRGNIERSLARLEARLGFSGEGSGSPYARLRRVAEKILLALEQEYGYKPSADATLNERIVGLRAFILKNIAGFLNVHLQESASQLDWIRSLRNALDDFIYDDEGKRSAYEKKIHEEKTAKVRGFYRDLDRVVNFISIYDGYLRDRLTQERFADVLDRLETEVFGSTNPKGPRLIRLDVGSPVDLLELYPEYKASKRATVSRINEKLAGQISGMVELLDKDRPAICVE